MNEGAVARNAMSELPVPRSAMSQKDIADLRFCFGIRPPRFFETLEVLVFDSFFVRFRNY